MEPLVILGIVGVVGLIATIIVFSILHEKKRREALQAFAASNGFTFEDKAESPGAMGLPLIELFNRGRRKRVTNAMAGEIGGAAVRVLDYRYTTGSGKNASTHQQTIVAISAGDTSEGGTSGAVPLPDFTLAPEHFFHKISQAFGYQDIDFDLFPEFSKKYLLRGSDEAAIRSLFGGRVIDAYMNGLGCNVELRDGWLFVFKSGKRMKVEEIQPRIESAFTFLFELTGA